MLTKTNNRSNLTFNIINSELHINIVDYKAYIIIDVNDFVNFALQLEICFMMTINITKF